MANSQSEDPKTIYHDILVDIHESFATRDFDRFAQRMHLPYHIRNLSERIVLRTKENLLTTFEICCATLVLPNGEKAWFEIVDAKFKGRDRINGTHLAILPPSLGGGLPTSCSTVTMWGGDRWKIFASDHQLDADLPTTTQMREWFLN